MGRVEAGERNGQVEAQAEVDQVERLVGRLQVVVREAALHHAERELLVVAAEAGVQAIAVLHDRGLDLVEPVRAVGARMTAEHALAPRLLGGEEVAHAARGVHLAATAPFWRAAPAPHSALRS